ncbi:hypothetical protein Bca101_069624 [Brassica carinata]
MGGLGFRDIECFNQALLAKIAWRLLKDPESLLAQTLRGKYLLSSSILDCQCPNSASHGWRGIVWGRDLLLNGVEWKVGNGESISVWTDPWLSPLCPLRPMGPPAITNQDLRVSDLLLPSSAWDLEAIRQHLPQYEDLILQIIPSSFQMKDELVWLYDKTGTYTSKSGYANARLETHGPPTNEFLWKKCIWNVNTAPKLQHFLWRAKSGALPVGSMLQSRGMQMNPRCKRCGTLETPLHLLLTCPFAVQVWQEIPALFKPHVDSISSISELLTSNTKMVNLPPTGLASTPLYPWVYWHLWKNRNLFIFENKVWSALEVALKVLHDARAWEEATRSRCKKKPQHVRSSPTSLSTARPTVGHCCFTDGAWDPGSQVSGQGWVIYDHHGVLVRRCSSNRSHVGSPLVAEALAVKAALLDVVDNDFSQLNLFSDSKSLITLLNSSSITLELQSILFDIRVLSRRFEAISFSFISRVGNATADSLAKLALRVFALPPIRE